MQTRADLRFAIVGTGGVGGYFGALLHRGGASVSFLARGRHLEAMRERGLRVESERGNILVPAARIAASPAEAGEADVVLFCVKSYDTESAARSVSPLLHDGTIVISLQNGMDNEQAIERVIPRGTVFGGVAYVYATIARPGVIAEWGGPRKIVFGPLARSEYLLDRGRAILQTMLDAGVDAECSSEITGVLWRKFLFIAAVGGVTALTRLTLGEILESPETRALLRSAMEEALAVAAASGAAIEPGHLDAVFERLKKYDNSLRSSLYHDLAHKRRLEIESLSGAVIRIGRQRGIATPVHEVILAALIPYHRRAVAAMNGPAKP
jgi:2-dehydropantoate 2-reductase